MKSAKIYMYDHYAGRLTEDENGFQFVYDSDYLEMEGAEPISLTMPLREEPYEDKVSSLSLTDWCQRDSSNKSD